MLLFDTMDSLARKQEQRAGDECSGRTVPGGKRSVDIL